MSSFIILHHFARNTVDCLNYIRELKEMNIPVFFEKESINTMDAKGEVLITIMASLAQQESESISKNVKQCKAWNAVSFSAGKNYG